MERNGNEIIHCGWLEKKGRVMKNWKRRWFTLRLQLLEYFDAQNGNKKGDIEISSETIVLLRDGSTHLFKFGIQTGNRILELSTNSDQDRIQWMDAIHNTVKLIQNRKTKASNNDGRIKDRVSNLLSKKTNMDEDTPMNRALRGHATPANDSTTTSKPPPRRANRRPRNKKTVQMSSHDRGNDCSSEESDQEQETVSRAGSEAVAVDETPVADLPSPPPQPLPEGWAQVMTEDGRIYYYHKVTRVSRWDFPTDEQPQQTQSQESNTDPHVTEDVEPTAEALDEEQTKAIVSLSVSRWLQPTNMNRTRSIPELLTTIPSILDSSLVAEGAICREPLTLSSPPSDVKKAYLRAIRLVHPDKLVGVDMSLEQRLLVQEVFIHISEKYDLYRKAHGL